jgi:pyruvate/2-oxoglutarate dehydrogenase complex dihydrolipoamide acyltransferase (E2) component
MSILQEIFVPRDSVNDEVVFIAKVYVQDNEYVEAGKSLLDIETSKAVLTIQSEKSGYIELCCNEGEDIGVGELLIRVSDTLRQEKASSNDVSIISAVETTKTPSHILFSKKAQMLVDMYKLSYDTFSNYDYVTEKDVLEATSLKKPTKVNKCKNNSNSEIDLEKIEIIPISNQKRKEIEYLSDVQSASLTSVVNIYVNMCSRIYDKQAKNKLFSQSLLPLVIYETSRLLNKYKLFNAYYHNNSICFYKDINIGVAVEIDDGLKVLTLYDVDKLGMDSVEDSLSVLLDKYLEKKLAVRDVSQSTFTISDLSANNVDSFVPLINSKQSAILGISKIDDKLNRFYLTLVFDHRITEGRTASMFLSDLKERIESYAADIQISTQKSSIKCSKCLKSLDEDRDLNGFGMVKIVNGCGVDDYICLVCLQGH